MTESRTKTRIISRTVLKTLALAGAISSAVITPNSLVLVDTYFKRKDRINARRTLAHLKYRKLIEVQKKNGQSYYRLTKRGRDKYQRIVIDELEIKTPRHWDNKWRLVMFDIPAGYIQQRSELLQGLKRLGFYRLQDSAWIHPFECEKQIGALVHHANLNKYITYLVVEDGNFVNHATTYFKHKKLLI